MKNIMLITALLALSLGAFAQVPEDLQDLIPSGESRVRLMGLTPDDKNCTVDLSISPSFFFASLAVLDEQGVADSRRFGKFQIGLGHKLQSIEKKGDSIVAVSLHKAEEFYSSDSLSTIKVNKPSDEVKAVQINNEEKGIFGFKTRIKEICILKQKIGEIL